MEVTLGPAALRDLNDISAFYLRESPRAAQRLADEFERLRELLKLFPDSGTPTQRPPVRWMMLGTFPYKVYYRGLSTNELRILRIRHARRRPLASL